MIVLGRITAPFGIKGWVHVHAFGDDPLSWRKMSTWWISPTEDAPAEAWRPLKQIGCKQHGKGIVAEFAEVRDRNAAEAIEKFFIGAPREALPNPGKDEYYWADLIGLEVVNEAGQSMGVVQDLLETGVHDVLQVVAGEGKEAQERLIPFVAAYVQDVDLASKKITVTWELDW